jgi:Tfp pilus assembly protein PilV
MTLRRHERPPAQAGFALIEVLVSSIVVVLAAAATFGLLQAMTRASAEQRHRSQAYAIAQEDQARLRSMRLTQLNHLDEIRQVTMAGTTFTVRSTGVFINDKTATVSCADGKASADYVQVTSVVTWPGMAKGQQTVLRSVVSPSPGSFDSTHGMLPVAVTNEKGEPKSGVLLEIGGFSATTNEEGCATFPDLPEGSQDLTSSGEAANLVSTNSNFVEETLVGIELHNPKVTKLIYDTPGAVPVNFTYWVGSSEKLEPATADSVVAFHNVMKQAKVVGTPGGTRMPQIEAEPLFPFTSPYSLYAGTCPSNNPGTGPGLVSATVAAGGLAEPVTIQLPALDLTVQNGTQPVAGAKVTITDLKCKDSKGNGIKRVYTTNSSGKPSAEVGGQPEPALPWGVYDICASAKISGNNRRKKVFNVEVKSFTSAKAVVLNLSTGTESGECPL